MQKKHTPINSIFNIKKKIGYLKPHSLAIKLGLSKRQYRKCSIVDLLLGHWKLISLNQFSYDNWARQISTITGKTISGQAICKRMLTETTHFLIELLKKSMHQKYESFLQSEIFDSFGEVLIQDATHFSLPRFLSNVFPGSYSRYGDCATAKIQATISLKKGIFRDLKLLSFRDSDQKDALRTIPLLHKNDLIIQDLGYFGIEVFKQINKRKASDLKNKELDLLKLLKKNKSCDLDVIIGGKNKIQCRLVAVKLPAEVAEERIRRAKKDRSKKVNHSKRYYEQLHYTIFITNDSKERWTPENIIQAYKTRWYIEILFKGWKSNLKIKVDIPERYMTKQRAEFYLYSCLLLVNLMVMPMFRLVQGTTKSNNQHISILKLSAFINQHMHILIKRPTLKLVNMMKYYCAYEKRKDRINAIEIICFTRH